jgi:diamine N-acetyltransferase
MLSLVEIDRHNYLSILDLSVSEEQRSFVASNTYSLAQAFVQPECVPLALYAENKPVGFAMYCIDESDREYWIYRLMIDQRHQGHGC